MPVASFKTLIAFPSILSLVAAAKGTGEGGSGPGLASSLESLRLRFDNLDTAGRDAILSVLGIDAAGNQTHQPAFPALKSIELTHME